MPSIHDARWRFVNHYLSVAEEADQFFSRKTTQEKGVSVFDQNRGQIESVLAWITEQNPDERFDIFLARFVDAISSIGLIRFSIKENLIPLYKRKIAAARNLGWKDLEADSLDGLGIVIAYLGYLPQALHYFESAYEIVKQTNDKELKSDIQAHIQLAKKQLKNRSKPATMKLLDLIQLIPLQFRFLFARIIGNPFIETATLNGMASIYLDWGKWNLSVRNYQRAISIAKRHAYRFGELQASLGLLQAEMSKDMGGSQFLPTSELSDQADDFEWGTDFSVLETLIEITPAIQNAEAIAVHLAKDDDPRSSEIYEQLDQIMLRMDEIVEALNRSGVERQRAFLVALRGIKDNLKTVKKLSKIE